MTSLGSRSDHSDFDVLELVQERASGSTTRKEMEEKKMAKVSVPAEPKVAGNIPSQRNSSRRGEGRGSSCTDQDSGELELINAIRKREQFEDSETTPRTSQARIAKAYASNNNDVSTIPPPQLNHQQPPGNLAVGTATESEPGAYSGSPGEVLLRRTRIAKAYASNDNDVSAIPPPQLDHHQPRGNLAVGTATESEPGAYSGSPGEVLQRRLRIAKAYASNDNDVLPIPPPQLDHQQPPGNLAVGSATESEPCAYSGTPGEDLQRRDNIRFSTVGLQPDESSTTSSLQQPVPADETDLAEALPIAEDDGPSTQAQPFDLNTAQQRKAGRRKQLLISLLLVLVAVCGVLGIGLGVGFGLGASHGKKVVEIKEQDVISNPTMPTLATDIPSTSPSTAPTGSLDLMWDQLPPYTLQSLTDGTTPQWKAMRWIEEHPDLPIMPTWRKKQLFALATIFYAMEGPHWPDNIRDDWMTYDKSECFWFSNEFGGFDQERKYFGREEIFNVTPCNENEEFQALILEYLFLDSYSPHMPPEISLLTSLQILSLPLNGIHATLSDFLPTQFYLLRNMTVINLFNNMLTGSLPGALATFQKVEWIDIGNNTLDGKIPLNFGEMTSMVRFGLYENNISGPIPRELGSLTKMKQLQLFRTSLSGPIPTELGLMSQMRSLELAENNLSGTIPSELALMRSNERLHLGGNRLHGRIPSELGALTQMSKMTLYRNKLTGFVPTELGLCRNMAMLLFYDNLLTGSIPTEVGRMTNMIDISASTNAIGGPVPSEMGLMTSMLRLSLFRNRLTGSLPREILMLNSTRSLVLSGNHFGQPIASEIGLMTSLEELDLYTNHLSGPIPSEIGMLQNMRSLSLADNQLNGSLPTQLGLLTNIGYMKLSANQLSGKIPSQIGLMTNIGYMELSANQLSGQIPSQMGTSSTLEAFQAFQNSLNGPIPTELGSASNMVILSLYQNKLPHSDTIGPVKPNKDLAPVCQ